MSAFNGDGWLVRPHRAGALTCTAAGRDGGPSLIYEAHLSAPVHSVYVHPTRDVQVTHGLGSHALAEFGNHVHRWLYHAATAYSRQSASAFAAQTGLWSRGFGAITARDLGGGHLDSTLGRAPRFVARCVHHHNISHEGGSHGINRKTAGRANRIWRLHQGSPDVFAESSCPSALDGRGLRTALFGTVDSSPVERRTDSALAAGPAGACRSSARRTTVALSSATGSDGINTLDETLTPRANSSISRSLCVSGDTGRAFCADQLWPDQVPSAPAEVPATQLAAQRILDAARFGRAHVPPACQALVQVLLVNSCDRCKLPTLLGRNLLLHTRHHSDSLDGVHANRYVETLSVSLGAAQNMRMETSADRRKRKLAQLCKTHGLEAVASRSGLSEASLDQILKGVLLPEKKDGTRSARALGDPAARAIEAAFDLGRGWFDDPSTERHMTLADLNGIEGQLVTLFRQLSPAQRDELLASASRLAEKKPTPGNVEELPESGWDWKRKESGRERERASRPPSTRRRKGAA